ncbi:MAG TPA: MATE family efflux transporter [Acidimicrobiia bacterium]|nr:MATE family efflux transporter [Acidimicrobiia bacterium]
MRQQRPSAAHDREILRLAIPAFGALAAEPLYVLADTAIVGHLGTRPLGGLGVAGAVLSVAFGIFNFLAYGTTATVARRIGAGDPKAAAEHGVAGVWLALGLGLVLAAAGLMLSGPIVSAMGASAHVAPYARTYLRISLLGSPFVLVALAGTGYLRGLQDTRTPLVIALAANALNIALEVVLVYGVHLGIAGSAWGTVIAQIAAAFAYLAIVRRNVRRSNASARPDVTQLRAAGAVGAYLIVRTGSLLLAFTAATSIASRIGDVQIAAHQVAFQLWMLLALCLDAIAIAGQAIVGRALGANDAALTRATSRRMLQFGVVAGAGLGLLVLLLDPVLALAFTRDAAVRNELRPVLVAVALMQPLGGAVFVLDGILIGAGDVRYLALAMAGATLCFVPCAVLVLTTGAGLIALWSSLFVFMFARLYGMGRRYKGNEWLVTGAAGT